jgi:hypothetical protein
MAHQKLKNFGEVSKASIVRDVKTIRLIVFYANLVYILCNLICRTRDIRSARSNSFFSTLFPLKRDPQLRLVAYNG